ncbi:hypothetical protein [Streptomyces decoyicus]|uniref:hypothetical protein n=1 Tax=Streptomyces decoyicus TaxID=249567 RepID=UPI0033AD33B1
MVVHGDDFYRPMDAEERAGSDPVQGYHRYFDWQRLRQEVLAPLAADRDAAHRRYDWGAGALAAASGTSPRCTLAIRRGASCR